MRFAASTNSTVSNRSALSPSGGAKGWWRARGRNFELQIYFYYTNRGAHIYLVPASNTPCSAIAFAPVFLPLFWVVTRCFSRYCHMLDVFVLNALEFGVQCYSGIEVLLPVSFYRGLSYFSFQPVLHDWCNKGRGMCYPVCGMVHIKEPLMLIEKSSPCGGSGFPFSLSEWSLTIWLTPINRK